MLTSEPLDGLPPKKKPPRRPSKLQPTFKVLIGITFLTALLLVPFAISDIYLDMLRDQAVNLYGVLRGEIYKQVTGYIGLVFALFEVVLTVRKRGRSWFIKLKIPGTMNLWRSLHIFSGVGMLAMIGVHTVGTTGVNFNAVFLWVFFIVTLTAVMGVVAETGVLESPRRQFMKFPWMDKAMTKGPLIKLLRSFWLTSHIFFVGIFFVMLVMHIALVYYYQ